MLIGSCLEKFIVFVFSCSTILGRFLNYSRKACWLRKSLNDALITSDARIGRRIVAVAVLDVNSVRKVIRTLMHSAMAKLGMEPRTVS